MADTPEQARARAALKARGNELAPQVDPATGEAPKRANSGTVALRERSQRAGQRRAVVKGAATGIKTGPAGAARGAAKGAAKTRKSSAGARARGYAGKRSKAFAMGKVEGAQSGALLAEYLGGAVIISLELFTQGASRGYVSSMARVMIRLTALTAVFFVLFLMQGSRRGGQFAVWFGLLVDLGIILTAARGQTFSTTSDIVSGKGIQGISLTSAGDISGGAQDSGINPPPQPEGVQLPDE
jgi:hypothetical protein